MVKVRGWRRSGPRLLHSLTQHCVPHSACTLWAHSQRGEKLGHAGTHAARPQGPHPHPGLRLPCSDLLCCSLWDTQPWVPYASVLSYLVI